MVEVTCDDELVDPKRERTKSQEIRDMCMKRPLTREERTLNIKWDDEAAIAIEDHSSTPRVPEGTCILTIVSNLNEGELFEDPEFPVGTSALFYRYVL